MIWGTHILGNLQKQTEAEGILPPALLLDGASQLRSARLATKPGANQGSTELLGYIEYLNKGRK